MDKQVGSNKIYVVWIIATTMLTIISLSLLALITIYIDPFFHYHAPLENYQYPLNNERYQNDGITRNYEYSGIITGTSMAENFKTSEADELFGASFVKVCFPGARYKEVNDNLQKAYDAGKDIDYVIRCLDYSYLLQDKDAYRTDIDYPVYLYNSNLFDDVNYVLNKAILLRYTRAVIKCTKKGEETPDFDQYANWNDEHIFGAEAVLASYTPSKKAKVDKVMGEEQAMIVYENIRQNVTDLADAHPETEFYLFFPPYSICYWDELNNEGKLARRIDIERVAIEEILKHPNIKLYSFCDNFELVCNLDNYKDRVHYGEWVNSWILEWMYEDKYRLTEENYESYLETISKFYSSYDYAKLWE